MALEMRLTGVSNPKNRWPPCSISFFRLTWHLKVSKNPWRFRPKKKKNIPFCGWHFLGTKNPTKKILAHEPCPLLKLPNPLVPFPFEFLTQTEKKIRGKDGNVDWYFDCVCQVLAMIDRLFESMLLFKSGKSHQSDPWVESWSCWVGWANELPSMYVAAV